MYMYTCTSQVSGVARILHAYIMSGVRVALEGFRYHRQLEVVATNPLSGVYIYVPGKLHRNFPTFPRSSHR